MSTSDPSSPYGPSDAQRDRTDPPSWQSSEAQPYGGQPYGGQPSGYDGRPARRNGLGVAALVLGIVALLFFWTVVAGVLGLLALVLGVVGARRARRGEATNRGVAITGAVLGAVAAVLAVVALVFYGTLASQLSGCYQLSAQGASEQQVSQCVFDQLGLPAQPVGS